MDFVAIVLFSLLNVLVYVPYVDVEERSNGGDCMLINLMAIG